MINSSYVPQISIQFVDIRGLSFFNEKDSPYRILFNFPPPIFNLKIKGYYGKTLEYQLHLVKYTTEFKADNGNFIIDADFVAITFAPLSDVLFRYIINFPLMTQNSSSMNPEQIVAPRNTNELVLKLKNLYSATNDKLKNSTESVEYDNIINKINANNDAILALSSFAAKLSNINSIGTPYVFINDTTSSSYSTL